jgi:hypothetical protein
MEKQKTIGLRHYERLSLHDEVQNAHKLPHQTPPNPRFHRTGQGGGENLLKMRFLFPGKMLAGDRSASR